MESHTTATKLAQDSEETQREQLVQAQAITEFVRRFKPSVFGDVDPRDDYEFERELHYLMARQTSVAQRPVLDHVRQIVAGIPFVNGIIK